MNAMTPPTSPLESSNLRNNFLPNRNSIYNEEKDLFSDGIEELGF